MIIQYQLARYYQNLKFEPIFWRHTNQKFFFFFYTNYIYNIVDVMSACQISSKATEILESFTKFLAHLNNCDVQKNTA